MNFRLIPTLGFTALVVVAGLVGCDRPNDQVATPVDVSADVASPDTDTIGSHGDSTAKVDSSGNKYVAEVRKGVPENSSLSIVRSGNVWQHDFGLDQWWWREPDVRFDG